MALRPGRVSIRLLSPHLICFQKAVIYHLFRIKARPFRFSALRTAVRFPNLLPVNSTAIFPTATASFIRIPVPAIVSMIRASCSFPCFLQSRAGAGTLLRSFLFPQQACIHRSKSVRPVRQYYRPMLQRFGEWKIEWYFLDFSPMFLK